MTSRRAKLRAGAAGLCVALLATACGTTQPDTAAAPADSAAAEEADAAAAGGVGLPVLVSNTVGGAQIDTNDLVGQDVVVWFWAPW